MAPSSLAQNQTLRFNLAIPWGVIGPDIEAVPSETSQNTMRRPEWLDFIMPQESPTGENPASCSSHEVVIQENVVHLCLFPSRAMSRLHQGFG